MNFQPYLYLKIPISTSNFLNNLLYAEDIHFSILPIRSFTINIIFTSDKQYCVFTFLYIQIYNRFSGNAIDIVLEESCTAVGGLELISKHLPMEP